MGLLIAAGKVSHLCDHLIPLLPFPENCGAISYS